MAVRSAIVNVMAGAAVRAARPLNRDFGELENLQASRKGTRSFVARACRHVEDVLATELSRARRDYAVLADGTADPGGPAWLIAPVDGGENLAHGVPNVATAIAARDGGRTVAGVVYDPLRDELYWAEKGVGAYVNHRRIRCAGGGRAETAVVSLAPPRELSPARLVAAVAPAELRITGAPALDLAYVASGRFDGFVGTASAAVLAAGGILLREAGALIESVRADGVDAPLTLTADGRLLATLVRRMDALTGVGRRVAATAG